MARQSMSRLDDQQPPHASAPLGGWCRMTPATEPSAKSTRLLERSAGERGSGDFVRPTRETRAPAMSGAAGEPWPHDGGEAGRRRRSVDEAAESSTGDTATEHARGRRAERGARPPVAKPGLPPWLFCAGDRCAPIRTRMSPLAGRSQHGEASFDAGPGAATASLSARRSSTRGPMTERLRFTTTDAHLFAPGWCPCIRRPT
jgi:hypothetical protein